MPKIPVLNAKQAEQLLLKNGFILVRTKGSHRIYMKEDDRIVVPFHSVKDLHPKIVKSILDAIKQENL